MLTKKLANFAYSDYAVLMVIKLICLIIPGRFWFEFRVEFYSFSGKNANFTKKFVIYAKRLSGLEEALRIKRYVRCVSVCCF